MEYTVYELDRAPIAVVAADEDHVSLEVHQGDAAPDVFVTRTLSREQAVELAGFLYRAVEEGRDWQSSKR